MSAPVTRRDFLGFFAGRLRLAEPSPVREAAPLSPPGPMVAVIQGRFCLAYRSFCSVCVERCPVPGAITVERGIPSVNAAACTGCGICAQVCPAPRNAILQTPRRPTQKTSSPTPEEQELIPTMQSP